MRSASLETSESVASTIASVSARRWRAIFIARTTSGCGRPADRPITSVRSSIRPSRDSASCDGRRGDLGAHVEQHQQVAQVGGEERHLVGAGDQDLLGGGDRLDRALDLGAADTPRRVLDVDVIGGDGLLERRLVEAEQRRGRLRRLRGPVVVAILLARRLLQLREALEAERLAEAHDRRLDVFARRASSSAVWKATSSRWSTTYWATSFCERENSSKRAEMYVESVWWPRAAGGMVAVLGMARRSFDGRSLTSSQPMQRLETRLDGLVLLAPTVHGDERGFFVETFRADVAREHGIPTEFVQDNHSRSRQGTLRGIHFQTHPGQGKLVRVARGRVLDVVVDLRRGSPTFGEWEGVELDDVGGQMLWIPVGFGHGFLVLSEVADFVYKCTNYYDPATEAGIRFDDPDVGRRVAVRRRVAVFGSATPTAPLLSEIADSLPFTV